MMRTMIALATLALLLPGAPAQALTTKQKSETCAFGANDQKFKGAQRKSFMAKCMAKGDAPGTKMRAPAPKPQ